MAIVSDLMRRRVKRILRYLPTGGGKTFEASWMIQEAVRRGKRCWFIVHRRELIKQTERAFASIGLDYGVIASGRPMQHWKLAQICSINTLIRRINEVEKPDFVCWDEVHHIAAKSYSDLVTKIGECHMVGLSASPIRLDGLGLGSYFDALVQGPSPRELIDMGYLCQFRTFAPPTVDITGLHSRAGDYVQSEAEKLMDRPSITGSAVAEYRKLCDGKRAIVFCCSIEHSKHVAQQFREAGYAAVHIDGKMDDQLRDCAIADFESGRIQILVNVELCGEGLSINAIECVILLRPTQSLALYIQQVGRGLRTWPGKKELIILDHCRLTERFGLIDETREWALTYDTEKKKRGPSLSVRICHKCWAASSSRAVKCSNCAEPFRAESRREVESRDGELVEVTGRVDINKRIKNAHTLAELLEIERDQGYAAGWAAIRWAAKQRARAKHMQAWREAAGGTAK